MYGLLKNTTLHKLINFICFVALITAIVIGLASKKDDLQVTTNGPTQRQLVTYSFANVGNKDYDCFLLGNSVIYRDINPDLLTSVDAFNFAMDNDNYNQMYYRLLWLAKRDTTIDTLIIGTDYFQFGLVSATRNYIYDLYLGLDYIMDYDNTLLEEIDSNFSYFWDSVRPNPIWMSKTTNKIVDGNIGELPYVRSNGQYIMIGQGTPNDTVTRKIAYLDLQVDYFHKIIRFCKDNNIDLYVVMTPRRDVELSNYTEQEMSEFNEKIEAALAPEYSGHYLNYSDIPQFKDYTYYVDVCHLNSEAANMFTSILDQDIKVLKALSN